MTSTEETSTRISKVMRFFSSKSCKRYVLAPANSVLKLLNPEFDLSTVTHLFERLYETTVSWELIIDFLTFNSSFPEAPSTQNTALIYSSNPWLIFPFISLFSWTSSLVLEKM